MRVAIYARVSTNIALRKASWAAGVPTLNPHSLRHRKGHLLSKSLSGHFRPDYKVFEA
jgi:hypothetical protein